jgi:NADH-quinone oxidoreductase subunit N
MSSSNAIYTRLWDDILPNYSFYLKSFPILILLLGGLTTMMLGAFKTKDPFKTSHSAWFFGLFVSFLAAAVPIVLPFQSPQAFLGSGFLGDQISSLSFAVIAIGTLFTLLASGATETGKKLLRYELISLLLFCAAGMMVMCASGEFVSFFIGLELTSIPLYVLVGYQRNDLRGIEAATKYFLLGATAAAILLMGAALIYISIGSLRFSDFALLDISFAHPFALLGVLLFICGLVFKLAIAPFHFWAPDVYQGANAHLSGYMASIVKFSVAIVVMRILSTHFASGVQTGLVTVFWVFGALSIVIGSLFGLVNNSVKRMLAYSSIANAGYFCLAFASLITNPDSIESKQALVSYAVIYAILSMGAFTVIAWLEDKNHEDILKEELAGIGSKKPFAAFALSVFLLGFAGIPPLAGFFGKFLLLLSAVHQGIIGLPIILIVFSCVSLYYYLSLMNEMWFKPTARYSIQNTQSAPTNASMKIIVLIGVIMVLLIGVFGPKFAMKLDYTQAIEKELRLK